MESTAIQLASIPSGAPTLKDFRFVTRQVREPSENEITITPLYLSVDPYMRGRLATWINRTIDSGCIFRVIKSNDKNFKENDVCFGMVPWQNIVTVRASKRGIPLFMKIPTSVFGQSLSALNYSHWLGALGLTGQTAYYGLLTVGKLKRNENVFVTGAAGATGMVVGQISKLMNCHVVGSAGNNTKVNYLLNELNFDRALNYKNYNNDTDLFQKDLRKSFPNGIDLYFDNTGGFQTEAVWDLLNEGARVVVCGQISIYNKFGKDILSGSASVGKVNEFLYKTIYKNVRIEGFVVTKYNKDNTKFYKDMTSWILSGKVKTRETFVDGFNNSPQAFIDLLNGKNTGKMIVRCLNQSKL